MRKFLGVTSFQPKGVRPRAPKSLCIRDFQSHHVNHAPAVQATTTVFYRTTKHTQAEMLTLVTPTHNEMVGAPESNFAARLFSRKVI